MALPLQKSPPPRGFYDHRFKAMIVNVAPGAHDTSGTDGEILSTVLGSCVAACIRDPQIRIGGINHFLLPGDASENASEMSGEDLRFGDAAMEVLINSLMRKGANRRRLEAKVFGGANMLPGFTQANVGARNAAFVLEFLKHEGIPILAQDLGGDQPRRVNYEPFTGRAWVHHLDAPRAVGVAEEEMRYRGSLKAKPPAGDLEIF